MKHRIFSMYPTLDDFCWTLSAYMPLDLSFQRVLYAFGTLLMTQILLRFKHNQLRQPHQHRETGWDRAIDMLIDTAFEPLNNPFPRMDGTDLEGADAWDGARPENEDYIRRLKHHITNFLENFNWPSSEIISRLLPRLPVMLYTPHLNCLYCQDKALSRDQDLEIVSVIGADLQWTKGISVTAQCRQCRARYYVDHHTYRDPTNPRKRLQRLEYDTQYLRVSQKEMIFVHIKVAQLQEAAIFRFKASWSGVADFLSRSVLAGSVTLDQNQIKKLFVENFTRRLILAHGHSANFVCSPNASSDEMIQFVLRYIGENGGILPGAWNHTCDHCTHEKRYATPEYLALAREHQRNLGIELTMATNPLNMQANNGPQLMVRMAVMDGKTLSHKICAISQCRNALENYNNGRFCTVHSAYNDRCAVNDCNRRIGDHNNMTCDLEEHVTIYNQYKNRFGSSSFLNVRRNISKNETPRTINLNDGDIENNTNVHHRFRARRIYCIETIQWACGYPIAWGKCYDAEAESQVLKLCTSWFPSGSPRPQFLVYDKACKLLSHLVTQAPNSDWFETTRFIVDGFHYRGHSANDRLCRERCNPQPLDGSQPDLLLLERNERGRIVTKSAFNTETAEQFNSWMDGFESQLRAMSNFSFDFFIHAIMLLYKEQKEGLEDVEN